MGRSGTRAWIVAMCRAAAAIGGGAQRSHWHNHSHVLTVLRYHGVAYRVPACRRPRGRPETIMRHRPSEPVPVAVMAAASCPGRSHARRGAASAARFGTANPCACLVSPAWRCEGHVDHGGMVARTVRTVRLSAPAGRSAIPDRGACAAFTASVRLSTRCRSALAWRVRRTPASRNRNLRGKPPPRSRVSDRFSIAPWPPDGARMLAPVVGKGRFPTYEGVTALLARSRYDARNTSASGWFAELCRTGDKATRRKERQQKPWQASPKVTGHWPAYRNLSQVAHLSSCDRKPDR